MEQTIIIVCVIAGGFISLWVALRGGQKDIKDSLLEIQRQVGGLRERMARLEGLFEGHSNKAHSPQ